MLKLIYREKDNYLIIDFEKAVFSKKFFEEFNNLQKILDTKKFNKIHLELSNLIWIDLMCLSYLVLSFIKNREELGSTFEIHLFNENSIEDLEHIRLINYLNTNSVFDVLKDNLNININKEQIEELICKNKETILKSEFQLNECVIPLTIIKNVNYISQNDLHIYEQLKLAIGNDISKFDFDMLYNKFHLFLQETVENVFEHAYGKDDCNKYCALIVRKNNKSVTEDISCYEARKYNIFNMEKVDKQTYQKEIEKVSPYGNRDKNDKTAYLEIFVTDIGCGLLKSFNVADVHNDRNIIQKIFSNGERSNKKAKTSIAGGLYMIHNLLAESNDSISIKSDLNWTNFKCSDQVKAEESFSYIYRNGMYQQNIVHGFAIVGYIGINVQNDKIKRNFLNFDGNKKPISIDKKIELLLIKNKNLPELTNEPVVIDLRFDTESTNNNLGYNNLVLLPSKHLSSKSLQKFVTNINKRNTESKPTDYLIIADIPDNEVNKYFNIFNKNKFLVKKLILISQSIKVAIFEFSSELQKLIYSRNETYNYCVSLSENMFFSLKCFCRWIRTYDSRLMWNFISQYQDKTGRDVFINEKVKWGGVTLEGYLDFSQVTTIQKCNKLCLYQMFRLLDDNNNYFETIDTFTTQLCEQANKTKNLSTKSSKIGIGSVYVTGISSCESPNEKLKTNLYFFNHSHNEDEIVSFFEWATNKNWVDKNFEKNKFNDLQRISGTPFIANEGNKYFMERHYSNINSVFEISTNTMYSLIQDDYGLSSTSISQIGHFNLDGKHDFLLVDVISLFRKAKIQRMYNPIYEANCWDYMLCELYYSLTGHYKQSLKRIGENINSKTPQRDNIINKIKSYGDIKMFNKKNKNYNGIIVYLNDFQTTYIIEELKTIFSNELQKRFYSIPTVVNDRTSTSLLISPLLTNILEKNISKLNSTADVTATIVSAITTSTKFRKELKHIMYRLGSKAVKTLTIIDRQRFSFGTYNSNMHKAFMKLDLPELGTKDTCVLCKGSEILKDFKKNINSNLIVDRIDRILDLWGIIKPSDDHHNVGIKIEKLMFDENIMNCIYEICQKYKIKPLKIDSNIGLVLFFIENVAISMSLELLEDCLNSSTIDSNIKILMICAYLIQFNHGEIPYSKRKELCISLYEYMHNQKKSNICSALGLLVLLSNGDLKDCLYKKFIETKDKTVASLDIFIFKLYVYNETKTTADYNYDYHSYLNSDESIPSIIYALNLYTNADSKHNHSRNLIRFYQEGKQFGKIEYKDAINAVEYLINEYKKLPKTLYYDTDELMNALRVVSNNLILLKASFEHSLLIIDQHKYNIPQALKESLKNFFSSAKHVNEMILCQSKPDLFYEKLKKICSDAVNVYEDIDNENDIFIAPIFSTSQNHWFYFYNDIIEEIKYFIGDFRHSNGLKIKNAITFGHETEEYTGIIKVEFTETKVILNFYNSIGDNITEDNIISIKRSKSHRPTMLDFDCLEKELCDGDKIIKYKIYEAQESVFKSRVLEVQLSLPYVDKNRRNSNEVQSVNN